MAATRVVTPPAAALSIEQAREQCRVDGTEHDTWFTGVGIPTVQQWCEQATGRTLLTTTYTTTLDGWPSNGRIALPWCPLQAVESVTCLSPLGTEQTLPASAWRPALWSAPAVLHLIGPLPDLLDAPDAVTVRYVAGDGNTPAAVPPTLRAWMLLQLAHLFAHREAVAESSLQPLPHVDRLLDGYRLINL